MGKYTLPEHRNVFYRDVEDLIDPGFLTTRWSFGDWTILFRSLYPADFRFIQEQPNSIFWHRWLVACSIYSINGRRIVDPTYECAELLAEWVNTQPFSVVRWWIQIVFNLNHRVRESITDLAPYLYEDRSREKWKYSRIAPSVSTNVSTGVFGIEGFGSNTLQRVWHAWNTAEDERDAADYAWTLTKAVLSGFSHKGVKQMDDRDNHRKDIERDRRNILQDKWLFQRAGIPFIDIGGSFKEPSQKTWDDLEKELHTWINGEVDFHDQIIEKYMNNVRERAAEAQKISEERNQQMMEIMNEIEDLPMVALTREELDQLVPFKQPGIATIDTRTSRKGTLP